MGSNGTSSVSRGAGDDVRRTGASPGHGRSVRHLAYSVQQRVRDFGVRRALGATTSDVLLLVIGSAVRMIATGAVIGLVLSTIMGRLLEAMLVGVQPLDLMTFASVTIVLALTAAVSIAGPAWRAARIDPAVALRGE